MRWKAKSPFDWRARFAWLPVKIGDEWLWLERYQRRFCGDFYEVAFETEWPHCCDQMRGVMWIDGKLIPEFCPVHG